MRFPYQLVFFVPSALTNTFRTHSQAFIKRGVDILPSSLDPLSNSSPVGSTTHFGASILLSEEMYSNFAPYKNALPSAKWFIIDGSNGVLLECSSSISNAPTGSVWNYDKSVEKVGFFRK